MSIGGAEPQKFVKSSNGVRKMNPEWKAWKAAQSGGTPAPPAMTNEATALPVVTSRADAQQNMAGVKVSEAVSASEEMLQDEDIAAEVGCADPVAELSKLFAKYEVPMGLMNKLMGLSDFQFIEMIVDDSGSMNAATDTRGPDGRWMTRWQEVHMRICQMLEIMALVPCPPCYIRFLNRSDVVECKKADGEPPQQYLGRVLQAIGHQWQRPPAGTTPARERIAESLARCPGQSMLRYFFGDGQPNGGDMACKAITQMLITRPNPQQNPFTFLSCTNEDEAVEWMKEAEEAAPFCSEADDYGDEAAEVLKDQGQAFPYTFGMHLICQLVAAFNPHDLDALDESAPMTANTLANILGYEMDQNSYKHYFDHFLAAQSAQPVESALDQLKKSFIPHWAQNFQHFLQAPMAHQIPIVQQYQAQVLALKQSGR